MQTSDTPAERPIADFRREIERALVPLNKLRDLDPKITSLFSKVAALANLVETQVETQVGLTMARLTKLADMRPENIPGIGQTLAERNLAVSQERREKHILEQKNAKLQLENEELELRIQDLRKSVIDEIEFNRIQASTNENLKKEIIDLKAKLKGQAAPPAPAPAKEEAPKLVKDYETGEYIPAPAPKEYPPKQ